MRCFRQSIFSLKNEPEEGRCLRWLLSVWDLGFEPGWGPGEGAAFEPLPLAQRSIDLAAKPPRELRQTSCAEGWQTVCAWPSACRWQLAYRRLVESVSPVRRW